MAQTRAYKQRARTTDELIAAGFAYYERKKQLVMAARLPADRAPMPIRYPFEVAYAEAGDVLCFDPGQMLQRTLTDYDHWSVKPAIFLKTYRRWDQPGWKPNATELHLMRYGCRPYYKHKGVWARQLAHDTWVQSLESREPVRVQAGMWLAVGEGGEPWHIEDDKFHARYVVPESPRRGGLLNLRRTSR
jgi:hypothetical protein